MFNTLSLRRWRRPKTCVSPKKTHRVTSPKHRSPTAEMVARETSNAEESPEILSDVAFLTAATTCSSLSTSSMAMRPGEGMLRVMLPLSRTWKGRRKIKWARSTLPTGRS